MPDEVVVTPAPESTPTPPNNGGNTDAIAMAKRLGELEAENKRIGSEYKEYKERVDPVIETLWSDQELLTTAQKSHRKRLGLPDEETPPPDKKPDQTPKEFRDPVARNALNSRTMSEFEVKHGIDKEETTKQKETRSMIGQMIKNMVDPQNNKTLQQVFDDIDPDRFGWYLENAYTLINREEDRKRAIEEGRSAALNGYQAGTASIGSMPTSSIDPDTIALTPKEKAVAKQMGVTEEKYLENKKRIIQLRNSSDEE